jgi:hypothetical protein
VEILQAIEQLEPVRLLKSSFFVYPLVNAVHIAAIGTLFASVVLMDLSVLGAIRSVPRADLAVLLRRTAFVAFAIAALTGVSLFSIQATTYVGNPAFLLKLGLIVLAVVNFLAFTVLDRNHPSRVPPLLSACAMMSILLWSGVLLCGRLIGFV